MKAEIFADSNAMLVILIDRVMIGRMSTVPYPGDNAGDVSFASIETAFNCDRVPDENDKDELHFCVDFKDRGAESIVWNERKSLFHLFEKIFGQLPVHCYLIPPKYFPALSKPSAGPS
jgi:hypothetical protein